MSGYLRRLATTGAAYTAASIVSKLIAVALLPLYTRYLTPADYGAAEVMFAAIVSVSIVVRLGLIEALLRFYYKDGEDPARVVATSFAALFWLATAAALIALPFAKPISELLLDEPAADLGRIAIGGLWVSTMFEYLLTLFRLEERARAFFVTTMLSVISAIGLTVILVVGADEGARGLLLGSYISGAAFVLGLIWVHRKPPLAALRTAAAAAADALRPADDAGRALALRAQLRRPDHHRPRGRPAPRPASTRSAVKFAQAVNVLVRGFQLAWPPLAYSIRDDGEARRAYATVVTLFVAGCAFVVTGMWLLSRWIVRALAAPEFFDSYEVIGLIATAVTLYALYMVLVVILGRTGRTEFNFPATAAALAANIALNLILVPPLGIVGAGIALVASYVVVLALMYGFTQRLFPVPYEWAPPAPGRRWSRRPWSLARRAAAADRRLRRPAPARRALAALPARAARHRLLHPRRARAGSPASVIPASGRRAARPAAGCGGSRRLGPRDLRGRADGRGHAALVRSALGAGRDARPALGEERLASVGPVDARRVGLGRTVAASARSGVGPGGEETHGERRRPAVVLAHVEVAVAVEFDDAGEALGEVGGELVVVDRLGGGDEEAVPAGVGEALGEVALVVVDEELRVHVVDLRRPPRGGPAGRSTGPSRPGGSSSPLLCTVSQRCRKRAPARAVPTPGKRQAQGTGAPVGVEQLRRCRRRLRVRVEGRDQRRRRPRPQLGVLVEQQAVLALRLAHQGRVVLGLAGSLLALDQADVAAAAAHRLGRAVARRRCRGRGSRARPPAGACARSPRGRRAGNRGRSCSRRSRRAWAPPRSR